MNQTPTQDRCPTSSFAVCETVNFTPRDAPPHACCCDVLAENPRTSSRLAQCGDDVLVFSPRLWAGPRPGKVMEAEIIDTVQVADVNILFHGNRDTKMLAMVRGRATGNTFEAVSVCDPLDEPARLRVVAAGTETWCEFKPTSTH